MPYLARSSTFARVTALAEQRPLHEAFRWLHLNAQQMLRWQTELISIPAPPFAEAQRSKWMIERFQEAGLQNVHMDELGNVFGELSHQFPAVGSTSRKPSGPFIEFPTANFEDRPVILISAHIDTVFPARNPHHP